MFFLPSQNEGKGVLVQAHGYMHHIIFIPLWGKEHEVFPQGGGEAKLQLLHFKLHPATLKFYYSLHFTLNGFAYMVVASKSKL